ncbi:hypothetical protein [Peribacillus saganii]|uniref:hypothetical protein n=1 Tax=Peribacillus saganii TaxID=2303992 RepID=UPI001314DE9B|nr:hypothetical protein [Peribacillus saganii]
MHILIILVIVTTFIYTVGFSVALWKEKNKRGAVAVIMLAVAIAVLPFFVFGKI